MSSKSLIWNIPSALPCSRILLMSAVYLRLKSSRRCLVKFHPDILLLVHTALLSVSANVNNHNLPQNGRLFILRDMGIS